MAVNINIIKASSVDLCATLNHRSDKLVTWKKSVFIQEDVKARKHILINDDGETIATGLSCRYTFKKNEFGKYIKFYAYVENFESIQQSTIFYVEEKCKTNVRIRGVERIDSDSSEIAEGQKIKLKVNKYSVDDKKVPVSVKKDIKWMIKVGDGKDERLIIDEFVITGDEIELDVPENWIGKEVMFMPYLNIHTPKISTTVGITLNKTIEDFIWTNENKEYINIIEPEGKLYLLIKTKGYESGEMISVELRDDEGNNIIPGHETIVVAGEVDEQGEVWVEAYNHNK